MAAVLRVYDGTIGLDGVEKGGFVCRMGEGGVCG
jgi:hypothetical protein